MAKKVKMEKKRKEDLLRRIRKRVAKGGKVSGRFGDTNLDYIGFDKPRKKV